MSISDPSLEHHLSNDLLIRAMDDELSGSETLQVERHLLACEACRDRQADLRLISDGFEVFIGSLQSGNNVDALSAKSGRQALLSRMEARTEMERVRGAGPVLARFGWFVAAAALVALGLSYLPATRLLRTSDNQKKMVATARLAQVALPLEIDGETFQYLPYSNPDLPLGGSHVVQMEVPISSLADAGVLVEPTASRMTMPDRAVLADVLLGMDGQPIGVHVLSAD